MGKSLHPLRHSWTVHGDIITKRGRKRIIEFRREERCDDCPRERHTVIDVSTWTVLRRRYKGKNVPLEDRVQADWDIATDVLATTPNDELRSQIISERMGRK